MEEEVLGKAYDSRLMRRLMGYMKPYRRLIALSLLFLLGQSLFQVLGPLLTRTAVDRYLQPNGAAIPAILTRLLPADAWAGLARIALLYVLVLVGNMACEFVQSYVMQYAGQRAMFD